MATEPAETYLKEIQQYIVQEPMFSSFQPKPDVIYLKFQPDVHPLSAEQQRFFVRLTEAIFGFSERARNQALAALSGLNTAQPLVPYFGNFIHQTVRTNVISADLSLLIYCARMTKSLLMNGQCDLRPVIHQILPAMLSCVLTRQLSRHRYDNHWNLRNFASSIVKVISSRFNTELNCMQARVMTTYTNVLHEYRDRPLTTIYGAIQGLVAFGDEAILTHVVPQLKVIGRFLMAQVNLNLDGVEVDQANYVRDMLITIVSPILFKLNNADDGRAYVRKYGVLGRCLYERVKLLEEQDIEVSSYVTPQPT